ncbi:MAG TPA: bifunctional pyr operon transcriptional regulator/uracil phosphoribosyltransferase PyrR [Spirochaetota bacterium]|nr:bifunctional pyr operon transcriptional regulator/uracil phosphoribosyltransferase PyrR [Spirochaetota bacterium]HPI89210.1 bifunctional pyr operon transcriptional regulator/uracil phosphoribosyltransferase PyrR [Spirochaetota bacterium]HPR48973.1 bifunctional pyr operon transcriptional regulator/uracil phosphoribosyltransferase PyrR [Spirochaetota bacterium]
MAEKILLNSADIENIVSENAQKIYHDLLDRDNFALVGVQTRGVELARRLQNRIEELSGKKVKNGILDITFYRDDLATRGMLPSIKETRIEFDIARMTIVLVDDVIFTGRTTKAALETITAFGRPGAIKLFALIDRGNRELPIQPDYCGYKITTKVTDAIKVQLREIDGVEDSVVLVEQ